MEVCKTDLRKIVRYLTDAAKIYDAQRQYVKSDRARLIRKLTKKLTHKLNVYEV